MRYLEINLAKYVPEFHWQKYNTQRKDLKLKYLWTMRLNILKMSRITKLIYKLNEIPVKIEQAFHASWQAAS